MFQRVAAVIIFLLCTQFSVVADPQAVAKTTRKPFPIQDIRLSNGLRVILSEDHTAPIYSLVLVYNVGSRDEIKGRTGFAHLFEHLMFEGSANVAKGEHMLLIQENGGNTNAATNQEWTIYFESLPSNQLELGLFLESDRMRHLAVTQAALDNQRQAVQEERRLRIDNQPYGHSNELLPELVYDSFSYQHSVIGSMDDLNAASLVDVQRFFKTYYAPNNAILTLVGDFKSVDARAAVKKYFGSIPSQPRPPSVPINESPHAGERRQTVVSPFASVPRLDIAYRIPSGNTPDYYALDMLFDILTGGDSSRLYQRFVKEQQLVTGIGGAVEEGRGPAMAKFVATPRTGKTTADVERALYAELDRLQQEPPTDSEMARVRTSIRGKVIDEFRTCDDRAQQIAIYTLFYNDPGLINTIKQNYDSITRNDLLRVAKQYLSADNRVVITTLPAPKSSPRPTGSNKEGN